MRSRRHEIWRKRVSWERSLLVEWTNPWCQRLVQQIRPAGAPITPRPFENAHQYAAAAGGPIQRNKSFFFVDYEGLRLVLPFNSGTLTLTPSPQFETATPSNPIFQQPNPAAALTALQTTVAFGDGTFTNMGGQDAFQPGRENFTSCQVLDDLSVDRGGHSFRFGINFNRTDISDHNYGNLLTRPPVPKPDSASCGILLNLVAGLISCRTSCGQSVFGILNSGEL